MSVITDHSWHKLIQCQADFYTPCMQNALKDMEKVMQNPLRVLKDDPTSTVILTHIANTLVVIKRANTKNTFHLIRRLFLPSRARKSWQNAKKLLQLGIKTFTPIALVEERIGPLKGRSYFLCTYIEGTLALNYFSELDKKNNWSEAADNLAKLSQQLTHHCVSHRDLNLSNIIFVNKEPWLLDLDAMRQHICLWSASVAAKRERRRFLQNCLETSGVSKEINCLLQAAFSEPTVLKFPQL